MTTPLPHWTSREIEPGLSTVEFDLPDFTRANITVATKLVGTPSMEAMIRRVILAREETKDQLREGF